MTAHRLPEDWQPNPSLLTWAKGRRPELDMAEAVDAFKDYWCARPGKGATKLDWDRTFRNFIRSPMANQAGRLPQAPKPLSHAPAEPTPRLSVEKRRENLSRLGDMLGQLFGRTTT